MERATAFAQAFFNASNKTGSGHWVSRCVQDRVDHTRVGVVREKDIKVRASGKTRHKIMTQQGVIV